MRFFRNVRLLHISDLRIAIVIGLVAAVAGWWSHYGPLTTLIDVNTYDLEPAVLWASGHGYSHATVMPPALEDFLAARRNHLGPEDLPKSIPVAPATGKNDTDRIYLAYAIGIIWRLLGINWSWLSILVGIGSGLTAALLYGIFRLGMNRAVSVAGAALAISSPLMLVMLPCLRDFWKGPFLLATILAVGYLLSRSVRTVPFLLLSAFLGAMIGVGYGFRQDGIICLPPAVFALVFLAHREEGRLGLGLRVSGVVLCLAAFAILAAPVLMMIRDTGGTNALYLLQGHAIYSQEKMGMRRACYGPVAQTDDAFVEANVRIYNARSSSENAGVASKEAGAIPATMGRLLRPVVDAIVPPKDVSIDRLHARQTLMFCQGAVNVLFAPITGASLIAYSFALDNLACPSIYGYRDANGIEKAGRHLLLHLVTTFPADVISRCYAATGHVLRGMRGYAATRETVNPPTGTRGNPDHYYVPEPAWYSPHFFIGKHLDKYGEYYALAALIIISTRSVWMALVALGLITYFCGYVGLFFQDRHAFHLEVFAYWFPAFCLERAFYLVRTITSRERRQEFYSTAAWFRGTYLPARRAIGFLALGFLALSLPLGAARLWQRPRVEDLLRTYQACQLDAIPFEERTNSDGDTYFWTAGPQERAPLPWSLRLPGAYTDPLDGLLYDYYAVEFETPQPCPPLTMRVLYRDCDWDCICSLRDDYDEGTGQGPFTVRYFFPVFQFTKHHEMNHPFQGFSLPPGVLLKNLYRVRNQQDFLLPMNLWLFEEPGESRWYQAIPLFGIWI